MHSSGSFSASDDDDDEINQAILPVAPLKEAFGQVIEPLGTGRERRERDRRELECFAETRERDVRRRVSELCCSEIRNKKKILTV